MIIGDNRCVFNRILTGTELPTYRQSFSDGQEDSVQHRCRQDCQGTQCATYCTPHAMFYADQNVFISLCRLLLLNPLAVCLQAGIRVSDGFEMLSGCRECLLP